MKNKIILYNNQTVDKLIYSSSFLNEQEQNSFEENENLVWDDFPNAKIICNFDQGLTSSFITNITNKITNYQIFRKTPEENFMKNIGTFTIDELNEYGQDDYYILTDYNIKNNREYIYSICPFNEDYAQTSFEGKISTNWDIFSLIPIYKDETKSNKYSIVKDEFGNNIVWSFQLNCEEGDIVLNQDKTVFTTFSSKPKISIGDLNYCTGNFSCLLGNTLYNDQYYEPNILLEKWNKMVKENHIYLFKNPKGDSMVIFLEDGTKRKYMNEVANYYIGVFNGQTAITNRPTTIEFSYQEIVDAENITVCGD